MNIDRYRAVLLAAIAILVALAIWELPSIAGDQIAIVVNTSNNVSGLSAADLHKIFLGEKSTWPNGKHVFLIMAPSGSPERAVILANICKMSEGDYAKYILQATFTGAIAAPPKEIESAAQIKQTVAANPGAIGYVKAQDVDDTVKVVLKVP
jgi:ABC-type phosphate transport system substrate-binding protein